MVKEEDRKYYSQYERMISHYKDIDKVTESGYQRLYDTATGTWEDVYISIDKKTGEIMGIYNMNEHALGTMTEKNAEALRGEVSKWKDTAQGILLSCSKMGDAYIDAEGNITNSSGVIIGKLGQVNNANGELVDAILDVNGNPIDIGENTDAVIKNLKETQTQVKNTDGMKAKITITDSGTVDDVQRRINNIAGKTVIVGVEYKNGKPTYNGSTIYATGTQGTPTDQIATVNEGSTWELVDTPKGTEAYSLGRALQGEMAYLPKNTKVTTALASTQKMEASIKQEVSRQVLNSNEQVVNAINNLSSIIGSIKNNNANLNINDVLDKIVIENITTIKDREIMRVITPLIDKSLNKYNKIRGK